MTGDVSKNMATGENVTNAIQSLDPNGFTVGTTPASQLPLCHVPMGRMESGRPREMAVGTYTGNGAGSQSIVSPDAFGRRISCLSSPAAPTSPCTKCAPGQPRTRSRSKASCPPTTSPRLAANGFTVGNDVRVNRSGTTYHYVAWNEIAGKVDVGTYTGNGADNRNITGVGFQPDFVMVQTNGGLPTVAHSTAMGPSTDTSHFFNATANQANRIQLLQPDGFQVGSAAESNRTGQDFHIRRLGASGANRGPHGHHERPPNGDRRRPRVAHGYEVDNLGFHVYRGSPTTAASASAPVCSPAPACCSRPASRPAPATRTAGATRRLARVRPTSSTGWKRSPSPASAPGTARSDRRCAWKTVVPMRVALRGRRGSLRADGCAVRVSRSVAQMRGITCRNPTRIRPRRNPRCRR